MRVLGITNNDLSGAALVIDGNIVAAASEERFNRIKEFKGWPNHSIEYVLRQGGIALSEVDLVAYGWSAGFRHDLHLDLYLERLAECVLEDPQAAAIIVKRFKDERRNDEAPRREFDAFLAGHGLGDRAVLIDHHECHALGAFLLSPFEDAFALTCDGRGDYQSLTLSKMESSGIETVHRETSTDSLGYFFGRVTRLLGFTHNRHEGKLTGLAAYGNASATASLMRKMIDYRSGRIRANCGQQFMPYYDDFSDGLVAEMGRHSREDVAAGAQSHLEYILTSFLADARKRHGIARLCLAGGVFGNVKLNQRIAELDGIECVFVLPCMGDGGLALCAAVAASFRKTGVRARLTTMSLGPEYRPYQPDNLLDFDALTRSAVGDDKFQSEIVKRLHKGDVIGAVRGRMEFGPRALCNRSLICSPADATINDTLNARLSRSEFMPFAPVIPDVHCSSAFRGWRAADYSSRFMTRTYDCSEAFAQSCPAVVHIDRTARPQVLCREDDPFMYDLLLRWHETTGMMALINTSFNRHEEPIICHPEQGVDSLREGIIDALLINDELLLTRREANSA